MEKDFGSLDQTLRTKIVEAEARLGEQEVAALQAIGSARKHAETEKAMEAAKRDPSGTPLEQLLGQDEVQYCSDFLEIMRAKDFPGARLIEFIHPDETSKQTKPRRGWLAGLVAPMLLTEPPEENPEHSWRGYSIGYSSLPHGSGSQPKVYLCEDEVIRTRTGASVYLRPEASLYIGYHHYSAPNPWMGGPYGMREVDYFDKVPLDELLSNIVVSSKAYLT